jgi:hypothetical protein
MTDTVCAMRSDPRPTDADVVDKAVELGGASSHPGRPSRRQEEVMAEGIVQGLVPVPGGPGGPGEAIRAAGAAQGGGVLADGGVDSAVHGRGRRARGSRASKGSQVITNGGTRPLGRIPPLGPPGHPGMDRQREDRRHPADQDRAHRHRRRPQDPRQPVAAAEASRRAQPRGGRGPVIPARAPAQAMGRYSGV